MSDTIQIVFSSDENYAKYLAVAIYSIVCHAADDRTYKIYIFEDEISSLSKAKILKLAKGKANITIEFVDVKPIIKQYAAKIFFVSAWLSIATYFRLFVSSLLPSCQKAIYVDCDVIFTRDCAELYDQNVDGFYLAGVRDIGLLYKKDKNEFDKNYFSSKLGISEIDDYINAGVLVMNLNAMREDDVQTKFIEKLVALQKPLFHDQCVINSVCKGRIKYLPLEYNYWGTFKGENPNWETTFPEKWKDAFLKASENPAIIHGKPWNNPNDEYAEIFFQYARETPFYECIVYENVERQVRRKMAQKSHGYNLFKYRVYSVLNKITGGKSAVIRKKLRKYKNRG